MRTDERTDLREPYQLHQIRFTKDQVKWLLEILPLLRNGWWPESEDCQGAHSQRAYFQTPIEVAAELDARLEKTGIDGAMAEGRYTLSKPYESLAKQYNLGYDQVKRRIRRAIAYMSGWRRKIRTYKQWIEHRRSEKWTKVSSS